MEHQVTEKPTASNQQCLKRMSTDIPACEALNECAESGHSIQGKRANKAKAYELFRKGRVQHACTSVRKRAKVCFC